MEQNSTSRTLAYGVTPRLSWRRALKIPCIFLVCLSFALVAARYAYDWYYYRELRSIRRELTSWPSVVVTAINGNEDLTLESIGASVILSGKPGSKVTFQGLNDNGGLTKSSAVFVSAIGPYEFRHSTYGYGFVIESKTGKPLKTEGFCASIDLMTEPFAGRFPFAIRGPKDVIDHYDQIVAEISRWPSTEAYETSDGTKHKLAVYGGNHLSGTPTWDGLRFSEAR